MMNFQSDLWTNLENTKKPILIYGMGNGADKILAALGRRGISVADFFASDGFVRGHSFHGKRVLSFSEAREKYSSDFVILLAFGSCLPDVLDRFVRLDDEFELYAPDVPLAGDELFDLPFYREHIGELSEVRKMFADDESRRVFDRVIEYRLTGSIKPLLDSSVDDDTVWHDILCPSRYRNIADLGAYNGDTIRDMLKNCRYVEHIEAWEPDLRSFRKLFAYVEREGLDFVGVHNAGAWDHDTQMIFSAEGNRNSSLYGAKKTVITEMRSVDSVFDGRPLDFIKMDVEGAERMAIEGAKGTISRCAPDMKVSLYHRSRDIFELPLMIHKLCPEHRMYIRKPMYVPAWDLCLYAVK